MRTLLLSNHWQFRQRHPSHSLADDLAASEGWIPAHVPGVVHQDLLAAGRIPDPFFGLNENDVQWVGESDWLYRSTFDLPSDFDQAAAVDLCFDGLDTFATVWLNGEQILTSDNMFLPHRVAVRQLLHPRENRLHILFESALRLGKQREARYGRRKVWNGDPSRVYVRKAPYHYGWDWGPCLITAGPWRPVRLEAYDARITDIHCAVELTDDLQRAILPVTIQIECPDPSLAGLEVHLELYGPGGDRVAEAALPVAGTQVQATWEVDSPELWWPHGWGKQPLYRLVASLHAKNAERDRRELRLGLRRLRLVQEPVEGEPGRTFLFEVNNWPIFCGGANWIPADSFLTRVATDRYRALLTRAAQANMTMLRVWGGGIYEEDVFYDLCDELGLLVWQDFMFACGMYPALDWFQASVRAEAEATVRRLRHHPCLALWCGNNEDYQIAYGLGAYHPQMPSNLEHSRFAARALYERILPETCATLDSSRPYWPGSPYGGRDPNDPTVGDRHTWEVWHHRMADYHDYYRFAGRLVSEFGMEALPDAPTIDSFTPPAERYPGSRILIHHNKAGGGPRRLSRYVNANLRPPANLSEMIYATQFVQAEAIAAALRSWRRRWGSPGQRCVAGALIWQLDDCWPVTSWSIIDYDLRPKPAYYVAARELAPLVVGLARLQGGAAVWAVNGATANVQAELKLRSWTLDGNCKAEGQRSVTLPANQAVELGLFAVSARQPLVLSAQLWVDGGIIARAALWPEPFKRYSFPDPGLRIGYEEEDTLRLSVVRPAKGVILSAGDGVSWSDNMLDLMPDDEPVILARGLAGKPVQAQWLH